MSLIDLRPHIRPLSERERLDALIAEFGTMRVLRAVLAGLFRRKRVKRIHAHDLSPHIQRDIGVAAPYEPPGHARHLY